MFGPLARGKDIGRPIRNNLTMCDKSMLSWLTAGLLCTGCPGPSRPDAPHEVPGRSAFAYPALEDNVKHDTLLIQTTFDMGDGTCVMVASAVEDTFEGLRLYRYRARPDSSAEVIAVSSPAYDSWTMLPRFFGRDSTATDDLWVLANFGEKESWGQKLLRLDTAFHDLAFMDAARPERVLEDDTLRLKRRDIAPYVRFETHGDTLWFRFACDSVYLYDDQAGGYDRILPAASVRYTWDPSGLLLWVNGEPRPVRQPS